MRFTIHHLQCLESCDCDQSIWAADDFIPDVDEHACLLRNRAPECPHCGGLARPNILMFGDWGWQQRRAAAQASAQEAWLSSLTRPLVIELGAGTAIPSARLFSQRVIHEFEGRLIRINPSEHRVPTSVDVGLPVGAAAGLAAIARALGREWNAPPQEQADDEH